MEALLHEGSLTSLGIAREHCAESFSSRKVMRVQRRLPDCHVRRGVMWEGSSGLHFVMLPPRTMGCQMFSSAFRRPLLGIHVARDARSGCCGHCPRRTTHLAAPSLVCGEGRRRFASLTDSKLPTSRPMVLAPPRGSILQPQDHWVHGSELTPISPTQLLSRGVGAARLERRGHACWPARDIFTHTWQPSFRLEIPRQGIMSRGQPSGSSGVRIIATPRGALSS
mmetsp:Transcript_146568/g.470224  ORF Transcript_146568/g.470224 Transcript_146568/m.470224 type:complete len:224 (-) Transcript_146568:555-1226(-)